MRTIILATSVLSVSAPAVAQADRPRVVIDTGALVGRSDDGVLSFKGIPFAAPPVGALRWRAPQPPAKWSGERDAGQYGHDCMQLPFPSDAAPLGTAPAEDCLYANVWRPAHASAKLPVMVWIYGGGFVNGGSSPPTYSGAELAKRGIMVVSFNYRLGRFGTFAHPQLTAANPDNGLLANYGYMDQLAALRWVRRNIAAFGGDPADVTIIGESAGGMSVHALITSPLATGLFHRAVIESGGPSAEPGTTLATAEGIGVAFAKSKGIEANDPRALAKLRALPADQVVDGLNLATMATPPGQPRTFTGPIADGRIAVDTIAAYQNGRFSKVPVLLGATSDDIGGPAGYMITGARKMAALFASNGIPTYYYRFSYVANAAQTASGQGAKHATDIPFFFDTASIKYGDQTTDTDRAASRTISNYLVNFVKRGDPNGDALAAWPRYSTGRASMLTFDIDSVARLTPDALP
ncbi:carboxylesterase family protein [Sphingomonas sp. H39-1-10]|uniref:carboxylesterase/lipase family protein n=1 Tax=Sphingomonas pollutisoli TaxID=3030829 RepID=UPI0023B90FE5|nr:carboxylesterase family protein [Sphingomonas pollutisoli]MDF0488445.1 carboxylesterase family protein [Sphingomonas pollutisoli]